MEDEAKRALCITAMEVLAGQLKLEPEDLARLILEGIAKPWRRIVILSNIIVFERN